jgi:hypothetical protein
MTGKSEPILKKRVAAVVGIMAVFLTLLYGFLAPGDQLPWPGQDDTVTVTVTVPATNTPLISYPPSTPITSYPPSTPITNPPGTPITHPPTPGTPDDGEQ